MTRRVLARLRPAQEDDGFTLVELLVSMWIFSIIVVLVVGFLVTTQREVAGSMIRLDDIDQAHMGIDSMSRTLRTAVEPAQLQIGCTSCTGPASTSTALTSATSSSIQLFANGGSAAGPSLVTFSTSYDNTLKQGVLVKTVQPPDTGSAPNYTYTACTIGAPGCLITSQTLIRGLHWPLPATLFTYYDNTGAQLTPAAGASLTATQLIAVDSISLELVVQTSGQYKTGATTIYGRVALPNSGSGVLPSQVP